jgi:hypothetical protein
MLAAMAFEKTPGIWFPAKRYGWGWGPPVAWQGWVVLAVWIALLFAGLLWFAPMSPMVHTLHALGMGALLIVVCWAKGERPRWRWGNDEK